MVELMVQKRSFRGYRKNIDKIYIELQERYVDYQRKRYESR